MVKFRFKRNRLMCYRTRKLCVNVGKNDVMLLFLTFFLYKNIGVRYAFKSGHTTFGGMNMEPKKRFIEIVQQLRTLIREEQIKEGDKLPSERVLSERLQVGRSAVREALRSLELLGLIETKHGGGTFLSTSPQHKLIEVLATFIMNDKKSITDVHATRLLHEQEAIRVICRNEKMRQLPVWESLFIRLEVKENVVRKDVLREIMIACDNRLALRIWLQLEAYSGKPMYGFITVQEKPYVLTLVKALQLGLEQEALQAHLAWVHHNTEKGDKEHGDS